ncbi:hypothetical protein [Pseudoalteromonas citrea]|nr:hypothetical protein [Pseudoalteromonas citrea]
MNNFRTYAYLRSSTIEQDETRAKGVLIQNDWARYAQISATELKLRS